MFKLIHLLLKALCRPLLKGLLGLGLAGALLATAHAQMAQVPLLSQTGTVEPNLLLIFDDSGSMNNTYFYQYGVQDTGGNGARGPGPTVTSTGFYSPDVNLLYYNPQTQYNPRLNQDGLGGRMANATVTSSDPASFNVYFFRNPSGQNVLWNGTDPANVESGYFGAGTHAAYTPAAALLAPSATTGVSYTSTVATSGSVVFPKFKNRTCAGTTCTLAEERQNYANWQLYYGTRNDLAQSGLGEAFQPLGATFRMGWGAMNADLNASKVNSGVGLFNDAQKQKFLTWLYGVSGSSGTPGRAALSKAGEYFRRADNAGPWANLPLTTSKGISTLATSSTDTVAIREAHASCRRSFTMLVTDGYYNESDSNVKINGSMVLNVDGSNAPTVTGTVAGQPATFTYNGATNDASTRPYQDAWSTSMADVAMYYWLTDLRPDVPNRVNTSLATSLSTGNPSFWQNMGFYGVGLGIFGTLSQTTTTLAQLKSGTTTWPDPVNNAPTAIDDMWHAAINTRGQYLSIRNSAELATAVAGMMSEINKVASTQSGVAASTLSLNTGTRKYTPKYTTGSWIGNVTASNLDAYSGVETTTAWQVVGTDAAGITYSGIPAHGSRNIIAATSATSWGSFNSSNSYATGRIPGGSNANLINYLRGDRTYEIPAGTYRPREELLGDIVNSTPVFIKGALDMKYEKLPAGTWGQSSYRSFIAAKAARAGVLVVGANDGMLHGFRDSDGVEAFAFVPQAVMPYMNQLANSPYAHRYFVDGPNIEADACIGSSASCTWTNLLIGTAGAGAKTVFALDVSTTVSISASNVKWEITTASTGFANLGYILSDVQTGLTVSGDWVAVFGNGYESADGSARLYVVNLNTGALIKDIAADTTGSNGLGGVRLVRDSNQRIIGAYAGDLKGKMWKFDLSYASSANWRLGLGTGTALYTGSSAKPITAAPAIAPHPGGGYIVSFGTGKLYESTDVASTTTQSLYGVWDSVPFGTTTLPTGVALSGTSTLVMQTISSAVTATQVVTSANLNTSTATFTAYAVSRNPIDWSTKRGWYIDLPNSGQRVIYGAETLLGTVVAIDTMSPAAGTGPVDPCQQSTRGTAWNYIINIVTGAGPSTAIFDTNGNGLIESTDQLLSGYQNSADGRTRYIRNDARSTSNLTVFNPLAPGSSNPPPLGISCATLNNCAFERHTWRQLFLR